MLWDDVPMPSKYHEVPVIFHTNDTILLTTRYKENVYENEFRMLACVYVSQSSKKFGH